MRVTLCGLAVAVVLLTSGCSVESEASGTVNDPGQEISFWIEIASESGASDHQLAILARAEERGSVTAGDVDEAHRETVRCYEDAGIEFRIGREEATTGSGVWIPVGTIIHPVDTGINDEPPEIALAVECEDRHHIWVSSAYMNQPSSRAARDGVWSTDPVRQCLEARGYSFSDDVTGDEVRQAENEDAMANQNDPGYEGRCVPTQG